MRVLFYIILTFVGLTLSAIIIAPSLFDIDTYKEKLVNLLYKETGNTLKVNKPIKLSLIPYPKIELNDLDFFKDKKNPNLRADSLIIKPNLLSLIKGKIEFESIELNNALFFINIDEKGANNWQTIFEKKSKIKEKTESNLENNNKLTKNISNKEIRLFGIKNLQVKQSSIMYSNNKEKKEINNINLNANLKSKTELLLKGNYLLNDGKYDFNYQLSLNKEEYYLNGLIKNKNLKFNQYLIYANDRIKGKLKFEHQNLNVLFKNLNKNKIKSTINSDINLNLNKKSLLLNNLIIESKGNTLKGNAKISREENNKNHILLNLESSNLNLEHFFNSSQINKNSQEEDKVQKTENNTFKTVNKLDVKNSYDNIFASLNNFKITKNVKIKSLIYNNLKIEDLNFKIYKNKNIIIDINAKKLFGGNFKSSSKFFPNGKIYTSFNTENLKINELNKITSFKYFEGNITSSNKYNLFLKNKSNLFKDLSGETTISISEMYLIGMNFSNLKSNIANLKNMEDLDLLKKNFFGGKSRISKKSFSLKVQNGTLMMPGTEVNINDNAFLVKGKYSLIDRNVKSSINFKSNKDSLLSLFKVNFSGNIHKLKTNIIIDDEKLKTVLFNRKKKEIEIRVKEKMKNKFDNLLNELLE